MKVQLNLFLPWDCPGKPFVCSFNSIAPACFFGPLQMQTCSSFTDTNVELTSRFRIICLDKLCFLLV